MNTISILKIESETSTLLNTKNAAQEIYPISKFEIKRNLNLEPIDQLARPMKLKCLIETRDIPEISIMNKGKLFTIYSIIKFRKNKLDASPIGYVEDSLETFDDHIIFRPILKMYLINFKCKNDNDGSSVWRLEFEEK